MAGQVLEAWIWDGQKPNRALHLVAALGWGCIWGHQGQPWPSLLLPHSDEHRRHEHRHLSLPNMPGILYITSMTTATGHTLLSLFYREGNWGSEELGSEFWETELHPLFITTPVHTSLTLPVHTCPAIQAGSNLLLFN